MQDTFTTTSVEETHALAERLLDRLIGACVVLLKGDLGSGKTSFAQGVGKALGVEKPMRSPTYTLVNVYDVEHPKIDVLVHSDLYRLDAVQEADLKIIGLEEHLKNPRALVLIEWPERLVDPVDGMQMFLKEEGSDHLIQIVEL